MAEDDPDVAYGGEEAVELVDRLDRFQNNCRRSFAFKDDGEDGPYASGANQDMDGDDLVDRPSARRPSTSRGRLGPIYRTSSIVSDQKKTRRRLLRRPGGKEGII